MQAPYGKTLGRNPRDRLLPLFLFPSAVYGSSGTPKYIAPMSHPLASDGSESHSSLQSVNGIVPKGGTIVVSVQLKDVTVCGWRLERQEWWREGGSETSVGAAAAMDTAAQGNRHVRVNATTTAG